MMNKKKKKMYSILFYYCLCICALVIISYGLFIFMTGISNFDTGHNLRYLGEKFNIELIDYYDAVNFHMPLEWLNLGYKQIIGGYFMSCIGFFLMGMSLIAMLSEFKK